MEFLAFLVVAGLILVIVGAIMGMLAKGQVGRLEREVDKLRADLKGLRAQLQSPRSDPLPGGEVEREAAQPGSMPTGGIAVPVQPEATPPPVQPPPLPVPPPIPARPPVETPPPPEPPPPSEPMRAAESATQREPQREPEREPEPTAGPKPPATPPPDQFAGMEKALGLRWLTWVGIGLLFLGVAFFLKYAYDRDWLGRFFGPRLRIATAAAIALTLAITGWRSLKNGMVALGQGLLGGGQALFYLTVFAAFQPALMVVEAPLFGPTTAFALMVAVTIAGLTVAVRLDAIAMAFLAVLGGFVTPVLISRGQDSRDLLCAYMLLLDLGVLGVVSYRRWRALDLLAFAGTVVLFGGWYAKWHDAHPQPDPTLIWLAVFHLVFLLVPFAHHYRHRTAVSVERFALALANVAWTLGYAAWMLHEPAPRLLASGCLVAAVLYLGLGVVMARRVGNDRRTRDGFLGLATLFLTLGLFYLLPVDGITTAWFAEASVLLWLGYRHAHQLTRYAALAVLVVAMVRTLGVHLPDAESLASLVWNGWFAQLLVAGLGLGAFGWIHRRFAANGSERRLASASGIGAGLWCLFACSLEIQRHAAGHPEVWIDVTPALAIAWLQLLGVLAFLAWAARWPTRATFLAALLPLACAAIAVGVAYDRYCATALPVLNGCCIAGLAACAVAVFAGVRARRLFADGTVAPMLFGLAQLAVTVLATVEAAAFLQRGGADPAPQTLGQTLAWVWLCLAVGGGLAAASMSSRRVLALAAIPLGLAVAAGLWLFSVHLESHRLIANQRFVFAVLAAGAVAATRALLQRIGPRSAADHAAAAALILLLLYAGLESVTWSFDSQSGAAVASWIVWLLGVVAVSGSAGGGWRARVTENRSLRTVAYVALFPAMILPLFVYLTEWDAGLMFLNLRAALVLAAILTAVQWARSDVAFRRLRWFAFAIALVGLTLEPPVWFLAHIEDHAEARRLALFSVTVTWVVTAATLLAIGFRRDTRPVRMTALALFALTAAKLLVLDMSGAQQLYRILAFILVGIVFVSASWLYHRAERRLAAQRE